MSDDLSISDANLGPIYSAMWAMRPEGLDPNSETYARDKVLISARLGTAAKSLERNFRQAAQVATRLEALFLTGPSHPCSTIDAHILRKAMAQSGEYAPDLPISQSADGLIVYGLGTLRAEDAGLHHANSTSSFSGIGGLYLELSGLYRGLFEQCAQGIIPSVPIELRTLIDRIERIWDSGQLVG